ncbi:MAG: family 10 glycosylhydrolase [Rikenellaceae bacterium]|jgi:uncharacterized lipoprotein YddW (UPF0748 family)|nr:family 10 glycosylhydrolase [Rikenellaceae bacterium]
MKRILVVMTAILLFGAGCMHAETKSAKPKWMWIDLSANWERLSCSDSIRYYVNRCRQAGITALVLDVKGTSGEVVYPSEHTSQLTEWKGVARRPDFDYVNTFIARAHEQGLEIYASLNTFAEGTGLLKRGILYSSHPEWQAVNYVPEQGLVRQLDIKDKLVLFANPALPEVQQHEIDLFREVAVKFAFDGLILDRARYDNIQSDFSDFSRTQFEKYIGRQLERFPEDIYEWAADGNGGYVRIEGPWFKKWIEWRASVIYRFFERARAEVKKANPSIRFGAYTGAWYPSYYEAGVNWASRDYDPSRHFDWATPEYKNYGYAELLDVYTNGNYYRNITVKEYRASTGGHRNETDSKASYGDHLCVEGACNYSRELLCGRPFLGGLYVEDYKGDASRFARAVKMNLERSDGLMIFDIVHIINNGWWEMLATAIKEYEQTARHER